MSDAPAYPTVTPYLLSEDAGAAINELCRAFGFREWLRYADDQGVVNHAELDVGSDGLIMIGHPGPAYRSPDRLGQNTAIVHVYVDDVDASAAGSCDGRGRPTSSQPGRTACMALRHDYASVLLDGGVTVRAHRLPAPRRPGVHHTRARALMPAA